MKSIAAASARLCVETNYVSFEEMIAIAAASARLCVETNCFCKSYGSDMAAASARLCVETLLMVYLPRCALSSRLRAAVC